MCATVNFSLQPTDNTRLANLCGALDGNINHIARALSVNIKRRGEQFQLKGESANLAAKAIKSLYNRADKTIDTDDIRLYLAKQTEKDTDTNQPTATALATTQTHLKNPAQKAYWQKIMNHAVTLCGGPAGTGKTHVAVAAALHLYQHTTASRLVFSRPVVEAGGERLGFLPGDMEQKLHPYLRPLQDILYQLIGKQEAERKMAKGDIEIMPLAFMRGITLKNAILIVDEAQNTTKDQMKMLLTRLDSTAKIIISGDETQNDLPTNETSGLKDAFHRLADIEDIATHRFTLNDIVRHPLVHRILLAYDKN